MIDLRISTQPDDETCGPTCLHSIYQFYGVPIKLNEVINTVNRSLSGGTLAPMLGEHAMSQGFDVTIYINNLDVFDPTWFEDDEAEPAFLMQKLKEQLKYKKDLAIGQSCQSYYDFIAKGGKVKFTTINVQLLKDYFIKKTPILTGLSATYLYRSAREIYTEDGEGYYDDIRGTPCGHFVILCGYDDAHRHVVVADPHRENPLSHDNYYKVSSNRLINAIMLGVYTHDANLIIIEPRGQ